MRKILILVDKIGRKKELFGQLLKERLEKGDRLLMARFSDLYFEIDGEKIYAAVDSFPLTEFNLVYLRRAGGKYSVIAGTLALCLEKLGVKFIDSTWKEIGPLGSKFTSLVKLSAAGLPVLPSVYVWQSNIGKYKKRIAKKLTYPLVAKELSMQMGKGVFLLNNDGDFKKLPLKDTRGENNQFLFQKFYPIKEEYRILVLGDKARVWEKKTPTVKGEFRHNVALGAKEEFLNINNLPEEIAQIAEKAARVLKLEIAGVDIAVDEREGKIFLIEVNRGPGLTYDTKISPEIDELAKYFKEESKK